MLGVLALSIASCSQSRKDTVTPEQTQAEIDLVGHKATITYPDFKADMAYLNDSTLTWKTTDADNKVAEGTEHFAYRKVGGNVFFLNWIEKDGTTVSQVIDINKKKVYVYLSYSDSEKGRGGRSADLNEGTIELK